MPPENPPTAPESLPKYLRKGLPKQEVGPLSDAREYIEELIEWKQRPVEDDDLPEAAEPIDEENEGFIESRFLWRTLSAGRAARFDDSDTHFYSPALPAPVQVMQVTKVALVMRAKQQLSAG